jgi:glycosyltransferase involved in cell wall biosynthesis
MSTKKKVAIIGTNGLPANYGGFETLTHFLTKYLNDEFEFIVYCKKTPRNKRLRTFNNANLKYLPFKANGWQSVVYDLVSIIDSLFRYQTLLILGAPAGFFFFINIFFNKRMLLNHGGFNEWERAKYSKLIRLWLFYSRKVATKFSDVNIGDNPAIIDSIKKNFNVEGKVIEYGGNHAKFVPVTEKLKKQYPFSDSDYFICVARAQIDNNIHIVIDGFIKTPEKKVVIISNWDVSDYGKNIIKNYREKFENVILLDAIYDLHILNSLRSNAAIYIHSHSFCGTSPSLVEAMHLGLPVICYDVPTNRYTTNEEAFFFNTAFDLHELITNVTKDKLEENGKMMKALAEKRYTWERITKLYAEIF